MAERLKNHLDKTLKSLAEVSDTIEDAVEDWSEETAELWSRTKDKLHDVEKTLGDAQASLKTDIDHAHVQAHLGIMEAHDQWQHISHVLATMGQEAASRGVQEAQHAKLQAHLASMDSKDFMAEKSEKLKKDYQEAKHQVEKSTEDALSAMEESLEKMGELWSKAPYIL